MKILNKISLIVFALTIQSGFATQKFYCPQYLTCVAQGECKPNIPSPVQIYISQQPSIGGIYPLREVRIDRQTRQFTCTYIKQDGGANLWAMGNRTSIFTPDLNELSSTWSERTDEYLCESMETINCGILISGLKK